MKRFRNAEEYYDDYSKRRRENTWWRISMRYLLALVSFFILMIVSLSGYWIWQDYSASGIRGITWDNFSRRASYRWQEFLHGRIGLDEPCTPQC